MSGASHVRDADTWLRSFRSTTMCLYTRHLSTQTSGARCVFAQLQRPMIPSRTVFARARLLRTPHSASWQFFIIMLVCPPFFTTEVSVNPPPHTLHPPLPCLYLNQRSGRVLTHISGCITGTILSCTASRLSWPSGILACRLSALAPPPKLFRHGFTSLLSSCETLPSSGSVARGCAPEPSPHELITLVAHSRSTIRFYRGWQSIRDYVLHQLPKRHTVASFDHLKLGSAYAFKATPAQPGLDAQLAMHCACQADHTGRDPVRLGQADLLVGACGHGFGSRLHDRGEVRAVVQAVLTGLVRIEQVILNGPYAVPFIIVLWFGCIVWTAYLFRLLESTACEFEYHVDPRCEDENALIWTLGNTADYFEKKNDYWIWNSLWIMWATTSSVGYGDMTATTHLGRLVAVLNAFTGVGFMGLLTASFANSLMWTAEEVSALIVIEREKGLVASKQFATRLILRWYHKKKGIKSKFTEPRSAADRENYTRVRIQSSIALENCMSDDTRVDAIFARVKFLEEATQTMLEKMQVG